MRVARSTSNYYQSGLLQHSTVIGKVHLPFSNQPSHFLPQPASSMSSSASLSSFDPQSQNLMTILSPQHITIPTNTVNHSQLLIYGFTQTQHQHQNLRTSSISEMNSTHRPLSIDLSVLPKIIISLSFRHHTSLPCSIAGLT